MGNFNKLWVFIGIYENIHILTLTNGTNAAQTKPVEHNYCDEYLILFDGLIEVLNMFSNTEIIFFANNDLFAFEWNKECLELNDLPSNNSEKWQIIKDLVKKNNNKLFIANEKSPLGKFGNVIKNKL